MDRKAATIVDLQRYRIQRQQRRTAPKELRGSRGIRACLLDFEEAFERTRTSHDFCRSELQRTKEELTFARLVSLVTRYLSNEEAALRNRRDTLPLNRSNFQVPRRSRSNEMGFRRIEPRSSPDSIPVREYPRFWSLPARPSAVLGAPRLYPVRTRQRSGLFQEGLTMAPEIFLYAASILPLLSRKRHAPAELGKGRS